jgi:hypothetical protein
MFKGYQPHISNALLPDFSNMFQFSTIFMGVAFLSAAAFGAGRANRLRRVKEPTAGQPA